jgi:RimJ/RimL family protein N-acetyltransferase
MQIEQATGNAWHDRITLTGRVVRLEPLRVEHAAGLLAAASPDIFRLTPQAPAQWSEAGFRADIQRINALSDVVAFAVVHLPSHSVIGRTTYMDIQPQHRGLEIGRTWLARSHQGTAVNPEMKHLLMRQAFETLGAIRVAFKTGIENVYSQRAIAKLGAVREGVQRQDRILPDGRTRDTVVFSVIDREWPTVKAALERRLGYAP